MKRRWVKALPSTITLLGAFMAFLALVWTPLHPYWACNAIIGSALCDMLDGRLARLTHTTSAFGTQLDSLADVISFVVAPAYLAYRWGIADTASLASFDWRLPVVFLFVAAGALRLARFNLLAGEEHEVGLEIIGLSTPAAALFVTATVMTALELEWDWLRNAWLLLGLMTGTALLMVSRLAFPSYKRFQTRWGQGAFYGLVVVGCVLVVVGGPAGAVLLACNVLYVIVALGRLALGRVSRPGVAS